MKLTKFGQDDVPEEGLERGREELRHRLVEAFEVRGTQGGPRALPAQSTLPTTRPFTQTSPNLQPPFQWSSKDKVGPS